MASQTKTHSTKRKTREQCIKDFQKVHGNEYIYDEVNYINQNVEVDIICKIHGKFRQKPKIHLKGCGCQECGKIKSKIKKKEYKQKPNSFRYNLFSENKNGHITKEDFIKFADKKWNGEYVYDDIEYIDYYTPINIKCLKHGYFKQSPLQHLRACGCKKCVSEYKAMLFSSNKEEFIEKANAVFHNLYSYDDVIYKNNKTTVEITCPKHGNFPCTPHNHLAGRGCPQCKNEKHIYENRLYRLLQQCFDKKEIIREYKVNWLTHNKSLDFYVPKYKLAIEHQGSQHFRKCDFLGGEEKYKRTIMLDREKYNECKENNVTLLYFAYEKYSVPQKYLDIVYTNENNFLEKIKTIKKR